MAKKTGQTSKLRAKLTKLFGLLGSENVGEREAARRKIDEILKVNRKRWNDLTELLQTGKDADEWRDPDDAAPSVASDPGATDPNAFDLLYFTLEDYLYFKHQPQELVAFTLWAMHTFVFDRFMITPRLALLSPVRGCGKSTAIDILERVTCRANKCDHSTTAGLYHVIDTERPTLLLDEVDNLELTTNGPMKAILNYGHKRGG